MSKKNKLSKILAISAVIGTAAAGLAYFYNKNGLSGLLKSKVASGTDTDDYEDEDFEFPEPDDDSTATREYITINKVQNDESAKDISSETENNTDAKNGV